MDEAISRLKSNLLGTREAYVILEFLKAQVPILTAENRAARLRSHPKPQDTPAPGPTPNDKDAR